VRPARASCAPRLRAPGWRQRCGLLPTLLIDHANCEKKAASTALALIFAYPEDRALGVALSRLAREELKHFEQVERLMKKLDVSHVRMKPGRYASECASWCARTTRNASSTS
jgi:tRNA isopentenyl-2-thiomethyl-A-37 hydroxylase MiaE